MANLNQTILTEEAKEHLKNATVTLWQAYCLLDAVEQAYSSDDSDLGTAIKGILALMSHGLNDLGEV